MTITIRIVPLPHFEGLALPAYETADAAGMDLRAAVPDGEPMTLKEGYRLEQDYTGRVKRHADSDEARIAFLEKREPVFKGE